MITLFLTMASLDLLRSALIHGGSTKLKLVHPGNNTHAVFVDIDAECAPHRIRLRVALAENTGEVTLDPHEAGFLKQAQIFIEDLVNGRIETAIPTPEGSATQAAQAGLSTADERTLRTICRQGGSTTLSIGTVVNVHASRLDNRRTAVAAHGSKTHLCSGSPQDVYLSLAEHIQQLAA